MANRFKVWAACISMVLALFLVWYMVSPYAADAARGTGTGTGGTGSSGSSGTSGTLSGTALPNSSFTVSVNAPGVPTQGPVNLPANNFAVSAQTQSPRGNYSTQAALSTSDPFNNFVQGSAYNTYNTNGATISNSLVIKSAEGPNGSELTSVTIKFKDGTSITQDVYLDVNGNVFPLNLGGGTSSHPVSCNGCKVVLNYTVPERPTCDGGVYYPVLTVADTAQSIDETQVAAYRFHTEGGSYIHVFPCPPGAICSVDNLTVQSNIPSNSTWYAADGDHTLYISRPVAGTYSILISNDPNSTNCAAATNVAVNLTVATGNNPENAVCDGQWHDVPGGSTNAVFDPAMTSLVGTDYYGKPIGTIAVAGDNNKAAYAQSCVYQKDSNVCRWSSPQLIRDTNGQVPTVNKSAGLASGRWNDTDALFAFFQDEACDTIYDDGDNRYICDPSGAKHNVDFSYIIGSGSSAQNGFLGNTPVWGSPTGGTDPYGRTWSVRKNNTTVQYSCTPLQNAECIASPTLQDVPQAVKPGASFTAKETFKNIGDIPWSVDARPPFGYGHRLGSESPQDNTRWGFSRVSLPFSPVPRNSLATFNINATAPAALGTYDFNWRMLEEGVEWIPANKPGQGICSSKVAVKYFCDVPAEIIPSDDIVIPSSGKIDLSWSAVAGATKYALRVADVTPGFESTRYNIPDNAIAPDPNCGVHYICEDIYGATGVTNIPVSRGHVYRYWVHAYVDGEMCAPMATEFADTSAVVSAQVFRDDNANGVQDSGEPWMADKSVNTASCGGVYDSTQDLSVTFSDGSPAQGKVACGSSGSIVTSSVAAGTHTISLVLPAGWDVTTGNRDVTKQFQTGNDPGNTVMFGIRPTPPPPATIELSPTSFTFNGVSGGATPSAQQLTIKNIGSKDLHWTAQTNTDWCRVSGVNSLKKNTSGTIVSYPSGTLVPDASTQVSVSVDAPSNVGTASCVIQVSDPDASNSPQQATVSYLVSYGPPGCDVAQNAACGGINPLTIKADNSVACSKITLTWTTAPGSPSQYRIYRNTTSSIPGSALATVSSLGYTDSAVTVGSTYYYWVESVGGDGTKTPANTNNAGIVPTSCGPTNVYSNNTGICESAVITWDNVVGETGYKIYRGTTNNAAAAALRGTVGVDVTTFTDTNVPAGSYYYFVSAVNGGGESPLKADSSAPIGISGCTSDLGLSDKDINNVTTALGISTDIPTNDCNGYDAIPAATKIKSGDIVTFTINMCNSSPYEDATGISITDSMTNLTKPTAAQGGWKARYQDASGAWQSFAAGNISENLSSANNPVLVFTFPSGFKIPKKTGSGAVIRKVMFQAVAAPIDSQVSFTTLSNKGDIYYKRKPSDASTTLKSVLAKTIYYNSKVNVPERHEKEPE